MLLIAILLHCIGNLSMNLSRLMNGMTLLKNIWNRICKKNDFLFLQNDIVSD